MHEMELCHKVTKTCPVNSIRDIHVNVPVPDQQFAVHPYHLSNKTYYVASGRQ